MRSQEKGRPMTNESDKQEQPQPERTVPPRQDDPLLGDYIQEGDKPNRETKQK